MCDCRRLARVDLFHCGGNERKRRDGVVDGQRGYGGRGGVCDHGNNYTLLGENSDSIHAIDLTTGARIWKKQVRADDVWSLGSTTGFVAPSGPSIDTDFGANPVLADIGGQKLVAAGDKASAFWALDRATGETVWQSEELSAAHTPNNGGVLMNGAFDGEYFYLASNEPPMQSQDVDITRVVPGHPDNSLLVTKLEGTQPCGDAMPPGGFKLKDAQLEQARDWVQMGAKDD